MRACTRLWMPALMLILAGCATVRNQPPPATAGLSLTDEERDFADALAHYGQAFLSEAEEESAKALAHLQAAAELDSRQTALSLQLAVRDLLDKRYDPAIAELEKIRVRNPRSSQVTLLLGYAFRGAGRPADALREYRRLIRLAPREAEGYIKAATILMDRQETSKAFKILAAGLEAAEAPEEILRFHDRLGRAFMANNQFDLAIRCFLPIEQRQPENLLVKDVLATLYLGAGEPEKAIAEWNRIGERDPENREVNLHLGEAYEAADMLDKAEANLRLACTMDPPQAEPFLSLAAFYAEHRPERVETVLDDGLRRLPNNPSIYAFFGLMRMKNGQFKRAIEAFEMAEGVLAQLSDEGREVSIPRLPFWHGMACERDGQFARAEELMTAYIKEHPGAHETLNYLAYMWADRGTNLGSALEYVRRALILSPDNAAYLDTLGWVHYRRHDYERAREQIAAALAIMPDDATICDHMGDVFLALHRDKEALRFWRKSFALDPSDEAVAAKLKARGVKVKFQPPKAGAAPAASTTGTGSR